MRLPRFIIRFIFWNDWTLDLYLRLGTWRSRNMGPQKAYYLRLFCTEAQKNRIVQQAKLIRLDVQEFGPKIICAPHVQFHDCCDLPADHWLHMDSGKSYIPPITEVR